MTSDPTTEGGGASKGVVTEVLSKLEALVRAATDPPRKPLLEALLELTLALDRQEARSLVEAHLPPLGPVESGSLSLLLLEAAGRRSLERRAAWVDALDPEAVAGVTGAKKLEALLVASWPKAVELLEQEKTHVVESFASSVARLTGQLDWQPGEFSAAVGAGGKIEKPDEASVTGWLTRCDCALIFESVGLLPPEDWREQYFVGISALAAANPADQATRDKARSIVLDRAPELVEGVGGVPLDELDSGIAGSSWLTVGEKHLARLRLAAARREAGQTAALPVAADELIEALGAVGDDPDRAMLEEAAGIWLGELRPSDDDAWEVAQRYLSQTLPDQLRTGLEEFAAGLDPGRRTAFAARALAPFPDDVPSEGFLEAIGFHNSDMPESTELIVQAFARATNEEGRRAVLRLWTALRLTDRKAITRLLDAIMIPLVVHGKASRELVLQHLHLVQALPNSDRRRLAQSIEQSASEDEWGQIQKRLVAAGFMVERGPPLFRRVEHLRD